MKKEILESLLMQMKQLMAQGEGDEEVEQKDVLDEAVEAAMDDSKDDMEEPMEESDEVAEEDSEEDSEEECGHGIDLDKVKPMSFKELMSDQLEYQEREDKAPAEGTVRISVLGRKRGNPKQVIKEVVKAKINKSKKKKRK